MIIGLVVWLSFGNIGFILLGQLVANTEYYYIMETLEDRRSLLFSSQILGPILLILTLILLILLLET